MCLRRLCPEQHNRGGPKTLFLFKDGPKSFISFTILCFHQWGTCVSEENVFLKCIVHKTEPLDLLFDYSASVQKAILLLPLLRECNRGFECSQQQ